MTAPQADGGGGARSPWSYFGLGFEIVVPMLLGIYGGWRLDRWLGTEPWLLLVGALLGMAAGFTAFFRSVLPPRGPKE